MEINIRPTVLFVHGSWHSSNHFKPVRDLFERSGFPTECPTQPTFKANPAPPVISLADDVKVVREVLTKLVDAGKEVIVVLHSYGGIVGTEAVLASFGKSARASQGLLGGVVHLLYMCAFVLPIGSSLAGAFGGFLPPFIQVQENGLCTPDEPGSLFYNDLPPEQQKLWISEIGPSPTIAQQTPLTYAAYQHYPVTYLYCTNDQAMPLEVQKMMISTSGVDFIEELCTAGHSPYLSQPEVVLKVVEKIAA